MRAVLLSTVLASSLLAACAKPELPKVTPKAARLVAVEPAGLTMQLDLDVWNPNSFPLVVHSVEGTFKLPGGQELGRGVAQPRSTIGAKQTAPVQSILTIPWAGLNALLPFVTSPQAVPYEIAGTAQIGGEKLNVSVPVVLKGALTRAELVQIGLRGLTP
jgi:LEA14-like dessication related protein